MLSPPFFSKNTELVEKAVVTADFPIENRIIDHMETIYNMPV